MLIKRNVYFSAIDQETGEEKLFSVSEVLDEETYLERLYSECKEDEKKSSTGKKVAAVGAGTVAAGAGAVYGANKVGKHMVKKANETGARLLALKDTGILTKTEQKAADKLAKNIVKGEALQKPAQFIAKHAGKLKKVIRK